MCLSTSVVSMEEQTSETELRERMIQIIEATRHDYGRYAELERFTGVSARKWKKLCNRDQNPTAELICALAKLEPSYAQWMLTGDASRLIFPIAGDDPLSYLKSLSAVADSEVKTLLTGTFEQVKQHVTAYAENALHEMDRKLKDMPAPPKNPSKKDIQKHAEEYVKRLMTEDDMQRDSQEFLRRLGWNVED